jgi:hypothetical protein
MYKLLSSYSDNELAFLLDATSEFIEQTREESKKITEHMKVSLSKIA